MRISTSIVLNSFKCMSIPKVIRSLFIVTVKYRFMTLGNKCLRLFFLQIAANNVIIRCGFSHWARRIKTSSTAIYEVVNVTSAERTKSRPRLVVIVNSSASTGFRSQSYIPPARIAVTKTRAIGVKTKVHSWIILIYGKIRIKRLPRLMFDDDPAPIYIFPHGKIGRYANAPGSPTQQYNTTGRSVCTCIYRPRGLEPSLLIFRSCYSCM